MSDFNGYFEHQLLAPLKNLPPLTIQDGKISLDKPMPYRIKNHRGQVITVIDTTGQITHIDPKNEHQTVLMTQDKLYFRPPAFHSFFNTTEVAPSQEVYVFPLNKNDNEIFDAQKWLEKSSMGRLKRMAQFLIYPLVAVFFFSMYLPLFLVLSFLGQLFAQLFFSVKLNYRTTTRLFITAATPQIVLFFGMITVNITFWGIGLLYVALLTAYFSLAILAVKYASKKMVLL
jgi:hypothetical protein